MENQKIEAVIKSMRAPELYQMSSDEYFLLGFKIMELLGYLSAQAEKSEEDKLDEIRSDSILEVEEEILPE